MEKAPSFNGLTVISLARLTREAQSLRVLYRVQNRHLKLFYLAMYLQLQGLTAVTK